MTFIKAYCNIVSEAGRKYQILSVKLHVIFFPAQQGIFQLDGDVITPVTSQAGHGGRARV